MHGFRVHGTVCNNSKGWSVLRGVGRCGTVYDNPKDIPKL